MSILIQTQSAAARFLLRNTKFNAETAEPAEKNPLKLCVLCVQPAAVADEGRVVDCTA